MLNPQQRLAVESTSGPVRIIAGAGTGKTHTLIQRVAYLINEKKIPAHKILVLTFTNKAAHELIARLQNLKLPTAAATTFHALAAFLLHQIWQPEFKIISSNQQETLLKSILTEKEVDKLSEITIDLSSWQQQAVMPEMTVNFVSGLSPERLEQVHELYQLGLTSNNELDFNSLLTQLLKTWRGNKELLQVCQNRYEYIMVDEYQDVNVLQVEIMKLLAATHRNIGVVGDPDQTIYSWRGANVSTMADFVKLYPEARTIVLEDNYRNPPAILKGAETLINYNKNRLAKTLRSTKSATKQIMFWESANEWELYEKIFHLLETALGSHGDMFLADQIDTNRATDFRRLNEIAILYRTQAQGKLLAGQLAKRGYPYQLSSPENFWARPEIQNFLRELETLKMIDQLPNDIQLSNWLRSKIEDFIGRNSCKEQQIQHLWSLLPYLMPFDARPLPESLALFLEETKTMQEADNLMAADRINLLTLHAAKGLEWPVVIIIGLEEDSIPSKNREDDDYWLDEERRLLYVGMTRATEELHLCHTKNVRERPRERSRFLAEIGLEQLMLGQLPERRQKSVARKQAKKAQMKMF